MGAGVVSGGIGVVGLEISSFKKYKGSSSCLSNSSSTTLRREVDRCLASCANWSKKDKLDGLVS